MTPSILVLPGSLRAASLNRRLAAEAARLLSQTDAAVTLASLADYPLPIFDADGETADGVPENARLLAGRIAAQDALLLVSPEYNNSVPALLKNALDWASRVRRIGERPVQPFAGLVVGLAAASPGPGGGRLGLLALRQIMMSLGAEVLTRQCSLPNAAAAFDEDGRLADERAQAALETLAETLVGHARVLGRRGG